MLAKIKWGLGIAGAFVVALFLAFWRGRAAGIQHIEAEQTRHRLESMRQRKEIDDEVDRLGGDDVDSRLNRWLRDDER